MKNINTFKTILCVDDDPEDRCFLCDAISEVNPSLQVVEAHNGMEALAYLDKAKHQKDLPCLIVLDINMPLMDGKQTLIKIKVDPQLKEVPVIMFSTCSNHMDKELFNRLGVELITKPSNISHLTQVVSHLLGHCA